MNTTLPGPCIPLNLESAQLAYLSACETAVNTNTNLVDEALHLTSAFQLAGFPHVIGTLWAINDRIAVDVARTFHASMKDPSTNAIDTSRAAFSLHRAIRSQRDKRPGNPSLWAAYMHAGA